MKVNKITIRIDTKNDAFKPNPEPELARVLRKMADEIDNGEILIIPRDINGNACGFVSYN
jgi:hypothetical protein